MWLVVPEAVRINLSGSLPHGLSGKDVVYRLMRELGGKVNRKVLEFSGPGVATLPVDGPVLEQARSSNFSYTRFIDDLTVSGSDPRQLINLIARQLSKRQLAISRKDKLKIMPRSGTQEVTGLLVNAKKPSLSKKRRDRVRAAVHQLRQETEGGEHRRAKLSVLGRINYVKQHNPGTAVRLDKQLRLSIRAAGGLAK